MAMNYFEIFGIPVQLKVDKKDLPSRFFELSKKYHPDYFINGTAEAQAEALEISAQLNKAFRTFQHPDETIKYVLMLKGLLQEEEKYELPPDFLMEVMDINEQLMDLEGEEEKAGLRLAIDNMEKEIYEPVKEIVENYKEDIVAEEGLLPVKEYYYKKKYLDRIKKELAQ
jgi:molecular chaperone HscB